MAMPSHTAMAGNSMGVPPAARTPALTASAILSRSIWPGTISLYEHTTPIRGRDISSSVRPRAYMRLRLGARPMPFLALSDFIGGKPPISFSLCKSGPSVQSRIKKSRGEAYAEACPCTITFSVRSTSWKRCPSRCRSSTACSHAARLRRFPSDAWQDGRAWS